MLSQNKQQVFGVVAALLLAAILIWLFFVFAKALIGADKSIQAAIVAAFVGVFTVTFTFWKERSRSIKEAHRDKKIDVYSKFYDLIFELLQNTKDGIETDLEKDKRFQETWFSISRGVLFYGSPSVVKAFSEFKSQNDRPTVGVMRAVGKILLAMRNDIGLSNFGLDELSIHQIYVSDDINKLGEVQ